MENKAPDLNKKLVWARKKGLTEKDYSFSSQQYEVREKSERLSVLIKLLERETKLLRSRREGKEEKGFFFSKQRLFEEEWNRLSGYERFTLYLNTAREGSLHSALSKLKIQTDSLIKTEVDSSNDLILRLQKINSSLDEDLSLLSSQFEQN